MNQFFERQKVDEIGRTAVRLEKLVLALAGLYLVPLLAVGPIALLGIFVQFLILYVAWKGATTRREKWLRVYSAINITLLVLSLISMIVSFAFVIQLNEQRKHQQEMFNKDPIVQHSSPSPKYSHIIPHPSSPTPPSYSQPHISSSLLLTGSIFIILYFLAVFSLKVSTIILALRLSKQIKSSKAVHLAHPIIRREVQPAKPMYIPLENNSVPAYHDSIQVNNPNFSHTTFYFPNQHAQV